MAAKKVAKKHSKMSSVSNPGGKAHWSVRPDGSSRKSAKKFGAIGGTKASKVEGVKPPKRQRIRYTEGMKIPVGYLPPKPGGKYLRREENFRLVHATKAGKDMYYANRKLMRDSGKRGEFAKAVIQGRAKELGEKGTGIQAFFEGRKNIEKAMAKAQAMSPKKMKGAKSWNQVHKVKQKPLTPSDYVMSFGQDGHAS